MSGIDWAILIGALTFIVVYGAWKTRGSKNIEGFILGDKQTRWWTVGLSVMATQASAITFLSTPGQAFHDGMGFVQFYFGLPIAMVIICVTFIPIYHRLKVYTAYEFLEKRFDVKTRTLAAILFLIQRGLAAGITIYAPAIILSTIMGWNLNLMNFIIGILVIIYTVSGGTKAVSVTQKHQMFVIMMGMFAAFFIILSFLPDSVGFEKALQIAGANDKMDILDFSLDPKNRYTFWSGITGGLFLALSYFGTDQSQVQRYLSGKSIRESQLGLIFNGLLKVPMQFFILLCGIMVFVFFQFTPSPIFFNPKVVEKMHESPGAEEFKRVEIEYQQLMTEKKALQLYFAKSDLTGSVQKGLIINEISKKNAEEKGLRNEAKDIIKSTYPEIETNDKDYVFIHFILNYLPKGLIGLLLAVIFSAAMSSTASELNALASTTAVDLYFRNIKNTKGDMHLVKVTRWLTVGWGLVAILFACFGTLFENLIQFVNIIGSVFYGTILGIFLVAFYIKKVKGNAVFWAAVLSEIIVMGVFFNDLVGYLWLNVIGCALVILFSLLFMFILPSGKTPEGLGTE